VIAKHQELLALTPGIFTSWGYLKLKNNNDDDDDTYVTLKY